MHVSPVWEVAVFVIMWGLMLEQTETALYIWSEAFRSRYVTKMWDKLLLTEAGYGPSIKITTHDILIPFKGVLYTSFVGFF